MDRMDWGGLATCISKERRNCSFLWWVYIKIYYFISADCGIARLKSEERAGPDLGPASAPETRGQP